MPDAGSLVRTKLKVFISYSRRDLAFVDRLQVAMNEHGIDAAVDRTEIEKGEDWWKRIQQLITEADTVVFVLSPGSVRSDVCQHEVDFAEGLRKRFVPIVAEDIGSLTIPDALARLNYIFFVPHTASRSTGDFDDAIDQLVRALEIDINWIREHTRLGALALRWLTQGQRNDLLLRGAELTAAERWITTRPPKSPDPSDAHRTFLTNSRRAATRRQRWWVGGSLALAAGAGALAALAYWQRDIAVEQRREAQRSESYFRAEQAKLASHDPVIAALLAVEGLKDGTSDDATQRSRPFVTAAWHALYDAWLHQRERAILVGHSSGVNSALFAPDGTRILTTSSNFDGEVRLWDGEGRPLAALKRHLAPVLSAGFSPDSARFLTVGENVRLWDRNGKVLATLEGHKGPVYSAVFAPDGSRILTASTDNTARLWDREGNPLAVLEGHGLMVYSAVFAPDSERILTASEDNTARLWDRDGKLLATLEGHTMGVNSAVFAPNGRYILTASTDRTARLWDSQGKPVAVLEGHTDKVVRAVFAPKGDRILTASKDNTARLWSNHGEPLAMLRGHSELINSAVFSPDGSRILTASTDKTARLWDREGKPVAVLESHTESVNSAVFAPDGGRILTSSWDGTARLWDSEVKSGAVLKVVGSVGSAEFAPDGRILTLGYNAELWDREGKPLAMLFEDHTERVTSAVFTPDGGRILTVSLDGTARLCDREGKPGAVLEHVGVTKAVFAPHGDHILTASADGSARLWDHDGKLLTTLEGHRGEVYSAVFAPDGERILTTSANGSARLWDHDGKLLTTLEGHRGEVYSAVFAPDGERILTTSEDKTARLWDRDGRPLAALWGHTAAVVRGVFAPDGGRILTASYDNTARLWDRDGKLLATLAGPTGPVLSVAFAPDGNRIAIAGYDNAPRLWDRDGNLLATLEGHTMGVNSVVFAPDGERILTASADGTARLWEVFPAPQQLVDRMKAELPRCLNPEQRQRFFLSAEPPRWCITMQKWPYDAHSVVASAIAKATKDAGVQTAAGRLREAVAVLEAATAANAEVRVRLAPAYREIAAAYISAGRPREAIAVLEAAMKGNAEVRARLTFALAEAYDKIARQSFEDVALKGRPVESLKDALSDAEKAVALDPLNRIILDTRGQIRLALGQIDEALADLDKAIAISPIDARRVFKVGSLYARGRAYELKGDPIAAVADYRKCIELAADAQSPSEYDKHAETEARARLQALGAPLETARPSSN
jgi:WD40 repeat protein/tetratricopeptide (TPR) repeat protein